MQPLKRGLTGAASIVSRPLTPNELVTLVASHDFNPGPEYNTLAAVEMADIKPTLSKEKAEVWNERLQEDKDVLIFK